MEIFEGKHTKFYLELLVMGNIVPKNYVLILTGVMEFALQLSKRTYECLFSGHVCDEWIGFCKMEEIFKSIVGRSKHSTY
jgi:hypothetical protein